ncbi:RNA polymerase sigma factor [Priestia megaterium]|uniref:RNA polymerase sigma factor n=1 Tax=Priestia megaterium TaxID=1404 RepID=UPI00211BD0FE|nr:sigma factor-like helix-turn-helix DNA-binding protein [Priestia megaterium]
MQLQELFKTKPIYHEITEIRTQLKKDITPEDRRYLEEREEQIRAYSVFLLDRVKNREEGAFEELMQIKDMRNFLHFYTHHIREYHKFRYGKQNVLHEVRFQIFYHVVNNYRIYNEPHEISLLIMSMRNWIRQKVSGALKSTYNPKDDERLEAIFLEETEIDDTEMLVRDLVDRYLDDEERMVFEMKFFEERGFVEIGIEIGASKDTAQRRYKRALNKLNKILTKEL